MKADPVRMDRVGFRDYAGCGGVQERIMSRLTERLLLWWRWRSVDIARINELEQNIDYVFSDKSLLVQALQHRSYVHDITEELDPLADVKDLVPEHPQANERLEFLGDAVLGLTTTDFLFRKYPDDTEGDLTKRKSILVSKSVLARRAVAIGLDEHLLLSGSEEGAGGRARRSILGDAYEALLGAMYLDGGLPPVVRFLEKQLFQHVDELTRDKTFRNYKSLLLEHVQAKGQAPPEYSLSGQTGPDHRKVFQVEVLVEGEVCGHGEGRSKKDAQQKAAKQAYERLTGQQVSDGEDE